MEDRDVGSLGESFLETWAIQAGIVPNRVGRDKCGWDFVLEFPEQAYDRERPLDKIEAPPRCYVQVKSSDQRRGYEKIKLSNLRRLVENTSPCFYLFVAFDGANVPQRAYLVHVGGDLIRRMKKRLRELSVSGGGPLHKHTINVNYNSRHELESPDGTGLKKGILEHVSRPQTAYSKWKGQLIENVGYENARQQIKIQFDVPFEYGGTANEYLADFAVGLIPAIRPRLLEIRDVRFDTPWPEPLKRFENEGRLELAGYREVPVMVTFASGDGSSRCSFEAQLRSSTDLLGISDKRPVKYRLISECLDIVFGDTEGSTISIRYEWPPDTEIRKLSSLYRAASVFLYLQDANEEGCLIEMLLRPEGGPESSRIARMDASTFDSSGVEEPFLRFAKAIQAAWQVSQCFGVQDEISISLSDIWRQQRRLRLFSQVFTESDIGVRFIYTNFYSVEEGSLSYGRAGLRPGREVACLEVQRIDLGQFSLFFVLSVIGKPKIVDEGEGEIMRVTAEEYAILKTYAFPIDQAHEFSEFKAKCEAADVLREKGIPVTFWDETEDGPIPAESAIR